MYGTYIGVSVRRPRPAGTAEIVVTWNPADKGTTLILTNGDLTTTNNPSGWDCVRATRSASSGKRYYEVLSASQATGSGQDHMVGISKATAAVNGTYLGSDVNGWGFLFAQNTPNVFNNGTPTPYGTYYPLDTNAVYGVFLDLTAGTLAYARNGVAIGTAYSGLSGTFFPTAGSFSSFQMTARFARASWTYDPGVGWLGWGE